GIGRDTAVRDKTADVWIVGRRQHAGAGSLADAEEADTPRVSVGPAFEIGQGGLSVAHLAIGHPLQRFITWLRVAVALVTRFKSEDVESRFQQILAIRHTRPAIRAELQAEKD